VQCVICGRRAESKFCKLHEEAHKNLLAKYEEWKKAMKVSWLEYLREIKKNPFAGLWVKEVAQYCLASGLQ